MTAATNSTFDASSMHIAGDLVAGLALLDAYAQGGNRLAGAALAHGVVTIEADEDTLRDQLATLAREAYSIAKGLAHTSRTWNQTSQEAVERREVERLRVHPAPRADPPAEFGEPVELRRLPAPAPATALALPEPEPERDDGLLHPDRLAEVFARIPRRRRWWHRLIPPRRVLALAVISLAFLAVAAVGFIGLGMGVWWIFEAVVR